MLSNDLKSKMNKLWDKFWSRAESDVRWNNRYSRLLKDANFRYTASLEQIDTGGHRGIDPGMLSTLAVGHYIKNGNPS